MPRDLLHVGVESLTRRRMYVLGIPVDTCVGASTSNGATNAIGFHRSNSRDAFRLGRLPRLGSPVV
jgi:hypothetical protein